MLYNIIHYYVILYDGRGNGISEHDLSAASRSDVPGHDLQGPERQPREVPAALQERPEVLQADMSIYLSISLSLSIYIYVYMCIYLYIYVCMYVYIYIYM